MSGAASLARRVRTKRQRTLSHAPALPHCLGGLLQRGCALSGASARTLAALLAYHRSLLADRRRNRAFERALAARVRPGDAVVDIGSGTGIWAVTAARLGARRVVAIEREELLCPVIERLAAENGVAKRVLVVCADARTLELAREFDLAISETVGTSAFEEGIVDFMVRAREHFVRPGGALMPMRVGLCAAPVAAPDLALGELKAASFQALACHVPRWIAPGRQRALARPRMLLSVDMRDVDPAQPLPPGSAEFVVQDTTRVAGLGVWVALDLAPGIRLSTRSGTHWGSVMLPIEPLPAGPGRLRFDVTWNPQGQRWGVVFEGRDGSHWSARYAPPFALGSLVLARRT